MKKRWIAVVLVCAALVALILWRVLGSTASTETYTDTIFAMDTYITQTIYDGDSASAGAAAEELINSEESILSRFVEGFDLQKVTVGEVSEVSAETVTLIRDCSSFAERFSDLTGFSLLMGSLSDLWGFGTDTPAVPSSEDIVAALANANAATLTVVDDTHILLTGGAIDFGGVAKGYVAEKILELYQSYDVTSAVVSVGGNIALLGCKQNGDPFTVGLRDPILGGDNLAGTLELSDCIISTSGGYERYFEQDGITYHHILDPATGYPADSDLLSVTVISQNGTMADYLSTALFVGGSEAVLSHLEEDDFMVIAIREDGGIYLSSGLQDVFTPSDGFFVVEEAQ